MMTEKETLTAPWDTSVTVVARFMDPSRDEGRQEGAPHAPCDALPEPSSCCRCQHGKIYTMPFYYTETIHGLSMRIPRSVTRATVMCGHPTALIPGLLDEYRLVQSICRHTLEVGEELEKHTEACNTCSGCEISCRNYEGPFAWEGWTASH